MKLRCASLARGAAVVAWSLSALTANAVELRGFRGVPWGAAPASLGAAAVVSERGEVRCWRRERENMLYGDSPIREVRFCFHREQLFAVEIDSEVDQNALLAEFQSTYGPPAFRVPSKASWGDRTTRARVEIVAPPTGSPASLHIYSNEYEPREKHARQ